MSGASSWDFTLANYDAVWSFLVQFGSLLLFLMFGNILRRKIPFFRKCLIPSALLGGAVLLIVNMITKKFGYSMLDNRLMQVITYHCLAIGFAAMSLKTVKSTHKTNPAQVVEFGALQGGTYMLQAFVGLGITMVLFLMTSLRLLSEATLTATALLLLWITCLSSFTSRGNPSPHHSFLRLMLMPAELSKLTTT